MIEPVAVLLVGLATAFFVWWAKGPLERLYESDIEWLRASLERLQPDPPDARVIVWRSYLGMLVLLLATSALLRNPVIPIALIAAFRAVPKIAMQNAWTRHRKTVNAQLPESIHTIAGSVASGMTLAQALQRAATRTPYPIRMEYKIMSSYWAMGADFETTLQDARDRLKLPDFNLLSSALLLNHRMGGDVTKTLEGLASALEGIEVMRREVVTATADGRMNIRVLTFAPFIMLGLTSFMEPEGVKLLFTTPQGQVILVVCVALASAGIVWASKIINADV